MLSSNTFFAVAGTNHPQLLLDREFAWDILKDLREYLASQTYPVLFNADLEDGIPAPRHLVCINGQISSGSGLQISFGDATRGRLVVADASGRQLAGASVIMAGAVLCGDAVLIGQGVLIEPGAMIKSPTIIGDNSEIRQGAYLRGDCLIGRRCIVGHVTEVKHSIFLDDAKAGHFAYLGDSILGNNVNLGAGTKLANLRFTKGEVPVRTPTGTINTGLKKLGAILGDQVQTGCNSVTNPGTLIGKKSMVMPNTTVPSGYHGDNSLIR